MATSKIDKVIEKLEKIDDRLGSVDKTLVKQEENLKEHMRRTDLLEQEIRPIQQHVFYVHGGLKLIGILSLVVTLIGGILKIISLL